MARPRSLQTTEDGKVENAKCERCQTTRDQLLLWIEQRIAQGVQTNRWQVVIDEGNVETSDRQLLSPPKPTAPPSLLVDPNTNSPTKLTARPLKHGELRTGALRNTCPLLAGLLQWNLAHPLSLESTVVASFQGTWQPSIRDSELNNAATPHHTLVSHLDSLGLVGFSGWIVG
jgi:hypothetical protein